MIISVIAIVIPLLFIELSAHQHHLCTRHQYSNRFTITISITIITTIANDFFIIIIIIFTIVSISIITRSTPLLFLHVQYPFFSLAVSKKWVVVIIFAITAITTVIIIAIIIITVIVAVLLLS